MTSNAKHPENVQEAHRAGIDLDYRAPDLPDAVRSQLPQPHLPSRPDWIKLYWRAWSIAFNKVRSPAPESGLVPFCDAAFSENIFQWDTCFMERFLRYAPQRFHALGSLDNFYRKQHKDGFICREINSVTGKDFWEKDHPSAVNPPLFADAEWGYFQVYANSARLAEVIGYLRLYDDWLRNNRRSADGKGFWTTPLGSGMDNSPRATALEGEDAHRHFDHTWICITAQQALAALRISEMASCLGEEKVARQYRSQASEITEHLVRTMWNPKRGCYSDVAPDGTVSDVMTPAMCWPLLLPEIPDEHRAEVAEHFADERYFLRPHAVPSLSADHPLYDPAGHYWRGSVWPPMVDLVARALRRSERYDLAVTIAERHLDNLSQVLETTGTLWENYAPEKAAPGDISRPEFVGWTGCGAIGLLVDTILGFQVEAHRGRIVWNLSRDDDHGIAGLPLAGDAVNLSYLAEEKTIRVESSQPFNLVMRRNNEELVFEDLQGSQRLRLS